MYKLEFLPIAKKDMDDIIYYISNNLKISYFEKVTSTKQVVFARLRELLFPFLVMEVVAY